MSKYIFLDIDGTLLDHKAGIPSSAKQAIQLAKQNGHKLFIATGRAKSEIMSDIKEMGFDGYVCSSGAVVEVDNRIILKKEMDPAFIEELIEILEQHQIGFTLEGYHHSFCDPISETFFLKNFKDQSQAWERDKFLPIDKYANEAAMISKVSIFSPSPKQIEKLKNHLKNDPRVTPLIHESTYDGMIHGELLMTGITKATGIEHLLSHCSTTMEDTVSFGDSLNDMEMIAATNLGVCMGNGVDALKRIADDVTDTAVNDGIYKSFVKHQII